MKLRTLSDAMLRDQRVLLRVDLNVPLKEGVIQDSTRIEAILPTVQHLLKEGASVILMTHLGRPEGREAALQTDVLAPALEALLEQSVEKIDGCHEDFVQDRARSLKPGELLLLENTRFYPEEEANDPEFSKALAALADLYVNDAFGAAHRAHASTEGVAHHLPSYAGLLMEKEVSVLSTALASPKKPVCLVVGGAKIDTKIGILERFLDIADYFLIGGALSNTFLAAEGFNVGDSLYQKEHVSTARNFLLAAEREKEYVYLPLDVVVSDKVSNEATALDIKPEGVEMGMKILDIGYLTIETFKKCIAEAGTIIWNGPMGLYELDPFEQGTREVIRAIAESSAESIVGGGDSIDALKKFGYSESDFTHVSTGGGAMLEFLEGKEFPALKVLEA